MSHKYLAAVGQDVDAVVREWLGERVRSARATGAVDPFGGDRAVRFAALAVAAHEQNQLTRVSSSPVDHVRHRALDRLLRQVEAAVVKLRRAIYGAQS